MADNRLLIVLGLHPEFLQIFFKGNDMTMLNLPQFLGGAYADERQKRANRLVVGFNGVVRIKIGLP